MLNLDFKCDKLNNGCILCVSLYYEHTLTNFLIKKMLKCQDL